MTLRIRTAMILLLIGTIEGCNLFSDAVWVGRFPLTLTVEGLPPGDKPNLSYYICWREWEAELALKQGDTAEMRFEPLTLDSAQSATIDVRCLGRTRPWGTDASYVQQKFLVIESDVTIDGEVIQHRQQFLIPEGRGPRKLIVNRR